MPSDPASSLPPSGHRPVTVVIAEDDAAMRFALCELLDHEPGLELRGQATDAAEAIALCERVQPDVCLVDVGMPWGGGPHAAREIRARCQETEVLAFSGREDTATVVEMLRAGACGYVVKGNGVDELVDALVAAASGRRPLSAQVAEGVVDVLSERLAREEALTRDVDDRRRRVEAMLARDSLSMVFQPIVALASGLVCGYEALARFSLEPVRSPDLWFAEAEAAGRLLEAELTAVRRALEDLGALPGDTYLSLNVSPETAVSGELSELVGPALGPRLVLEITEHAPIDDYASFAADLEGLRARGVRIAIDDTGAGFASLRHILRLAPDIIKIDMTLTRRITTDRAERALTRALISFAAETGATVVAEGVESEAEIGALSELGVPCGQGYHLGRPERAVRHSYAPRRDSEDRLRRVRPAEVPHR